MLRKNKFKTCTKIYKTFIWHFAGHPKHCKKKTCSKFSAVFLSNTGSVIMFCGMFIDFPENKAVNNHCSVVLQRGDEAFNRWWGGDKCKPPIEYQSDKPCIFAKICIKFAQFKRYKLYQSLIIKHRYKMIISIDNQLRQVPNDSCHWDFCHKPIVNAC